jgi:hypothetical protein
MQEALVDAASAPTNELYHQTVLRLADEFSGTEVAWTVSQHVVGKLWDSSSPEGGERSSFSSKGDPVPVYLCQFCGYRLHPGWNGTSLRVKRPGGTLSHETRRTLRRRELRKRKRKALEKEQQPRGHRHNRTLAPSRPEDAAGIADDGQGKQLVVLRDDPEIGRLDRNRLVLTCGKCKGCTYLKGLRREPQPRMQPLPSPPKPSPSPSHGAAETLGTSRARTPPKPGAADNLSENFERLPKLSLKRPPAQANAAAPTVTQQSPPATMSLLEQKLVTKRKKKKKNPPKKSGNLIDFLSSLNNH